MTMVSFKVTNRYMYPSDQVKDEPSPQKTSVLFNLSLENLISNWSVIDRGERDLERERRGPTQDQPLNIIAQSDRDNWIKLEYKFTSHSIKPACCWVYSSHWNNQHCSNSLQLNVLIVCMQYCAYMRNVCIHTQSVYMYIYIDSIL